MKKILAALLLFAVSGAAHAQVSGLRVVPAGQCGTPAPYSVMISTLGAPGWLYVDANGLLCTNASGGGGGGGVVTQGAQDATAAPWQMVLYQGGALVGFGNGLYTNDSGVPITGQTLSAGGSGLTGWLSQVVSGLAKAPNLSITGPATAAWTGITPGGTAASTQYAGDVNIAAIGGKTTLLGAGVVANTPRVGVAQDATTIAGAPPGRTYQTVAASQTAQVLQTSTGAIGDYLSHCVVVPATTAPGVVTILDNATAIYSFPGGTLTSVISWPVPVGAVSTSGAWKVTTGANVSVFCSGKFS